MLRTQREGFLVQFNARTMEHRSKAMNNVKEDNTCLKEGIYVFVKIKKVRILKRPGIILGGSGQKWKTREPMKSDLFLNMRV